MSAFTVEEKKNFRMKLYLKRRAFDFALEFIKNILLTELVLHFCAGSGYLKGAILALGYTVGWAIYDIIHYKKDWIDMDIKPDGKTES